MRGFGEIVGEMLLKYNLTKEICSRKGIRIMEGPTRKIVPMKDKILLKRVKENIKMSTFDQPLTGGLTQFETKGEIIYVGRICTIPSERLPDDKELYQIKQDELLTVLKDGVYTYIPVHNGTIEYYEIFDMETGDVRAMYRVPYMRLPDKDKELLESF